jgi:hypothetical protein
MSLSDEYATMKGRQLPLLATKIDKAESLNKKPGRRQRVYPALIIYKLLIDLRITRRIRLLR